MCDLIGTVLIATIIVYTTLKIQPFEHYALSYELLPLSLDEYSLSVPLSVCLRKTS